MSFRAIAHAADISRKRRFVHPARSINSMELSPCPMQPGQTDEYVFEARTKCCDTDHFEIVGVGIYHNGVDNFRRIFCKELELVSVLTGIIHRLEADAGLPVDRGSVVERELNRLHTLDRLFQPFRGIYGGDTYPY